MVVGSTSQVVRNVDGNSVLEFHVEENLGDREPNEFSLEVQHNPDHTYLANKTNSINQSMRSTNAILMGLLHKTQGLTLPKVTLALDGTIFSTGQAYVALSRSPNWNSVDISHLDRSAFMTDPNVILEYQRLETVSTTNPHLFS